MTYFHGVSTPFGSPAPGSRPSRPSPAKKPAPRHAAKPAPAKPAPRPKPVTKPRTAAPARQARQVTARPAPKPSPRPASDTSALVVDFADVQPGSHKTGPGIKSPSKPVKPRAATAQRPAHSPPPAIPRGAVGAKPTGRWVQGTISIASPKGGAVKVKAWLLMPKKALAINGCSDGLCLTHVASGLALFMGQKVELSKMQAVAERIDRITDWSSRELEKQAKVLIQKQNSGMDPAKAISQAPAWLRDIGAQVMSMVVNEGLATRKAR